MESATLSRPSRPGPIQPARLSALLAWPWEKIALGALCVGALIGYLAFPTYPTYDSFYALLWGRDLLHLHLPDFSVYRGPTEHPLAIAFGAFCSLFGQGGARLMVLGAIASFVALVVGLYRLGKLCFGTLVGVLAGLLMLSRFYDENLAAQGYLDLTYVALVVWATVLEAERPRRGTVVFLMLAAAGLLRPDAWVLSGVYWIWCCWPRGVADPAAATDASSVAPAKAPVDTKDQLPRARVRNAAATIVGSGEDSEAVGKKQVPRARVANRTRLKYLGLAAIAPLVWVALDAIVTGDPLYSLHSTSGLAQELERTQGFSSVLASVWTLSLRIDHLPVVLGALLGAPLALWLAPRRALLPFSVLVLQLLVFLLEGAAGASVIGRYMMGAAAMGLLFCAVAIGGWSMLLRGSKLRLAWMIGALVLVGAGTKEVVSTLSFSSLRNTLAYHEDFHKGLAVALESPAVKTRLKRCPLLSLPNNKLIPDARWILDSTGQGDIVARSQARADAALGSRQLEDRIRRGSVAVYPLGQAVFFEAIVDVGDDARDQIPLAGFKRIYTSQYYAVYANC